ncbi:carboxymuconolactone decarboxylase family protein [Alkalimonas collagenimarina]|uniref:Carboxymuconolactone decarboxylase family protein n=1 Tax=Alkalimonas collagenimarina TaxID=400390 RepID=A0ABT9H381_9GAMM|nr:carboxymuconolactone decarboxylase family protein [Alkalimonas collagenimarina]MDP4537785.1 carboxymuconolactone decarboxylase family protein [Alkalimonas collagenimarina]
MSASSNRLTTAQLYQLQPQLAKSLLDLAKAASTSLDAPLLHLVKLRVSQINGCAFCMQMHAAEARRDGEQQVRLDVLVGWPETTLFTEREQVALRWAECLTQVATAGVPDILYQQVSHVFTAKELADLTAVIIEINSWNRIAVSFHTGDLSDKTA